MSRDTLGVTRVGQTISGIGRQAALVFALACVVSLGFDDMVGVAAANDRPARGRGTTPTGEIVVAVSGLDGSHGKALIAIYTQARGFPGEARLAFARAAVTISNGTARARFSGVPAGPVAVAVLHDEDGDLEMDTGLLGIPTEGYGVSRDAVRSFGPPIFDEAKLRLVAGERTLVRIRMHY